MLKLFFRGYLMRKSYKNTYLLILLSILLSYVFWVIDSLYVYEIYQQCAVDALLRNIPPHSYFARIVVIILSLLTAFLISYYYHGSEKVKSSLLKTVEMHQVIISTVSDGLFDYDLENGKFYLSNSFYLLLGYEPGEFPQNRFEFEQRIHPDDRFFSVAKISESLKNGLPFEIEFRFKRKNGDYAWLKGTGKTAQKDQKGQPLRVVGTYKDNTALKDKEIEFYDNR